MKQLQSFIFLLFLPLVFGQALGKERDAHQSRPINQATGIVTRIIDGDTFSMRVKRKAIRMRLAQIDAPENGQKHFRQSQQSLRELIGKKSVSVYWREKDRYGRPVVQVVVEGKNVNVEQVKRGMAWVAPGYVKDPFLFVLEGKARDAGLGLWKDNAPIPPWVWRKQRKPSVSPK